MRNGTEILIDISRLLANSCWQCHILSSDMFPDGFLEIGFIENLCTKSKWTIFLDIERFWNRNRTIHIYLRSQTGINGVTSSGVQCKK